MCGRAHPRPSLNMIVRYRQCSRLYDGEIRGSSRVLRHVKYHRAIAAYQVALRVTRYVCGPPLTPLQLLSYKFSAVQLLKTDDKRRTQT